MEFVINLTSIELSCITRFTDMANDGRFTHEQLEQYYKLSQQAASIALFAVTNSVLGEYTYQTPIFCHSDITTKGYEGQLNLFFGERFIACIKDLDLARQIRHATDITYRCKQNPWM